MGRSRGGLTTKIHAPVDAEGRAIRLVLTAGQAGDAPAAHALLSDVRAGSVLLADKAYDTDAIRSQTASRGAFPSIPPRITCKQAFPFSPWLYRQRNAIERFFYRIKQMRGIATRYDRLPENYLAALKLVAVRIWIKTL